MIIVRPTEERSASMAAAPTISAGAKAGWGPSSFSWVEVGAERRVNARSAPRLEWQPHPVTKQSIPLNLLLELGCVEGKRWDRGCRFCARAATKNRNPLAEILRCRIAPSRNWVCNQNNCNCPRMDRVTAAVVAAASSPSFR